REGPVGAGGVGGGRGAGPGVVAVGGDVEGDGAAGHRQGSEGKEKDSRDTSERHGWQPSCSARRSGEEAETQRRAGSVSDRRTPRSAPVAYGSPTTPVAHAPGSPTTPVAPGSPRPPVAHAPGSP